MLLDKYLKEIDDERQEKRQYLEDQLKFWTESLSKSMEEVQRDSLQVQRFLQELKEYADEIA